MDAGIEKECSALGGLFQLIMNDMKVRNKIKHNLLGCLYIISVYLNYILYECFCVQLIFIFFAAHCFWFIPVKSSLPFIYAAFDKINN